MKSSVFVEFQQSSLSSFVITILKLLLCLQFFLQLAFLTSPLSAQNKTSQTLRLANAGNLGASSVPKAKELELLAQLPLVPQEMRGSWLVTVHNIDWPSVPGAPTSEQQAELLHLLDQAKNLGLNTILLQVRDVSDAFYPSDIEPWSVFLTGYQGKAPNPVWDPLAFAIKEAHKRGLELHAWLNPYRVGYLNQSRFDPKHIFRRRPDLVRLYDDSYWLDPGNPDSEAYILSVVKDVVSRYPDLDGLHYDDYFYPYPKAGIAFRDDVTKKAFADSEGLGNWRRKNIDLLVQKSYRLIKSINPYISFGISPFGIWRNNQPRGVRGLESYYELYADSRKWLREGWVDYLAPQFYWAPDSPQQPYEKMLDWWLAQNVQRRQLMAGINVTNLKAAGNVDFEDILRKVNLRREYHGHGEIFYSLGKINTPEWQKDVRSLYPYQALPTIVGPKRPPLIAPVIKIELERQLASASPPKAEDDLIKGLAWQLGWRLREGTKSAYESAKPGPKYWVMYYLKDRVWNYRLFPGWVRGIKVSMSQGLDPRYFAVAGVDRGNAIGNISWFGSIPVDEITEVKLASR